MLQLIENKAKGKILIANQLMFLRNRLQTHRTVYLGLVNQKIMTEGKRRRATESAELDDARHPVIPLHALPAAISLEDA